MVIIQKPDILSFSGNVKDIILSGVRGISFILSVDGNDLISEIYTGFDGRITIPIQKIVDSQLKLNIPGSATVFTQNEGVKIFSARILENLSWVELESFNFTAVKGGIADVDETSALYMQSQWLTLQPQQKNTTSHQPEWLGYYSQSACNVIVKAYFADSTSEETTIAILQSGKLNSINLSFQNVNSQFDKQVGYYDVWIEDAAHTRLSYIQRYILTPDTAKSQIYVWENTLGAFDSVCFDGSLTDKIETTGNITTAYEESQDSDIDFSVKLEQNTGYLPTSEYARWLRSFFLSEQRYHVLDKFRKIYLVESDNKFNMLAVNSYTFEFLYSVQTKYDYIERDPSLLPHLLEFPTLEGLFFLAPRLGEFPIAAISDNLMIPVQFSFEDKWRTISIAAVVQAAITASVDATAGSIDLSQYWSKGELIKDGLYLKFLATKISAGNADKWDDNKFTDFIDQSLRTTDDVVHKSITSPEFKKGQFAGQGFGMYTDENGNAVGEVDILKVRKEAIFNELVINQVSFILNETVFSGGGCELTSMEEIEGAYRCFYDNKNETRYSGIKIDDQARCQRFDKTNQNIIKYYWRKVVGVGENYIDLSITDVDGSGIPSKGDNVVQFGNKTDITRQSAIVINPQNGGSVEIYAKIDSYNLIDKNYVGSGVDPQTGEAYQYVYGDIFFGDRNLNDADATFITYQLRDGETRKRIVIQADMIFGSGSSGLTNLSEWKSKQKEIDDAKALAIQAQEFLDAYKIEANNIFAALSATNADFQNQLDDAVSAWDGEAVPTLLNHPADQWETEEDRAYHKNDSYARKVINGEIVEYESYKFRFSTVWAWELIADSGSAEAIIKAREALGVANSKVEIRYSEKLPSAPYNIDDLWINHTTKVQWISNVKRLKGEIGLATDWEPINDSMLQLSDLASDGKLTPAEKLTTEPKWEKIKSEKAKINAQALVYALSTTAYDAAYKALSDYISPLLLVQSATSDVTRSVFDSKFKAYFDTRQDLLNLISKQAKEFSDNIAGVSIIVDTTHLSEDFYYPVWFRLPLSKTIISVKADLGYSSKPSWATHAAGFQCNCDWTSNGSVWGSKLIQRIVNGFGFGFAESSPIGSIGQVRTDSAEYIYVRGGGKYTFCATNGKTAITTFNLVENSHTFQAGSSYALIIAKVSSIVEPVTIKTEITDAKQDVVDLARTVSSLDETMNTTLKDGILDEAEKKTINEQIKVVNQSWADMLATYTVVYQNTYLEGSAKTTLLNTKTTLAGSKTTLITSINNLVNAATITTQLRQAYTNAYSTYTSSVSSFKTALENANKAIQIKLDQIAAGYVDNIEMGGTNYISKQMMLAWNSIQPGTATAGSDSDGDYLLVMPNKLYAVGGLTKKDIFADKIKYKTNTQYTFSVEWKAFIVGTPTAGTGVYFLIYYTDGTSDRITQLDTETNILREDIITKKGKTIDRISSTYGTSNTRSKVYNIQLTQSNKVMDWITAQEDIHFSDHNLLLKSSNSGAGWENNSYPTATIHLGDYKPSEGEEMTIVLKGELGAGKSYFGIYNSGGNVSPVTLYPSDFIDGIARKTFKWRIDSTANTLIRIYPIANSVTTSSRIEYVKLIKGNKTSLLWTEAPEAVKADYTKISNEIATTKANLALQQANTTTKEAKEALQLAIDTLATAKADADKVYDKLTVDGKIEGVEYDILTATTESLNAAKSYAETVAESTADGKITASEAKITAAFKKYADVAEESAVKIAALASDGKITDSEAKVKTAYENYTDAAKGLAIETADAHADGKITDSEAKTLADAVKKLAEAKLHAETVAKNAVDELEATEEKKTEAIKNDLAQKIGYANHAAMIAAFDNQANLINENGMLRIALIEAGSIIASMIAAGSITAKEINATGLRVMDAFIDGYVRARTGKIGELSISGGTMINTEDTAAIILRNTANTIGSIVGTNAMADILGFAIPSYFFNNKKSTTNSNIAQLLHANGGVRNFGTYSNAAILGTAMVATKKKNVTKTNPSIPLSQFNLFCVDVDAFTTLVLPPESLAVEQFEVNSLPSDFACIFTIYVEYGSEWIRINNVYNQNYHIYNPELSQGDSITLMCTKNSSLGFHYKEINKYN